jgi:CRP-like cAMP-binding protein
MVPGRRLRTETKHLPSDFGGSSRHLVTYADGERIFAQGDHGDEMYIVQDGEVEIVLTGDDGTEVSLATLERGDFFGEMAVLEGAPRTATARSKGGCTVLPLRGALFVEMLQRDPETTLRIMRKLCSRIRELQDRLSDLADGDASFVREAAPTPAARLPAPVSAAPDRATAGARLVHASGVVLALGDVAEARVGRPDSALGIVPEIDLTPLNEARTVSRSHARILRRDGKLFVVAEAGATNGTFVAGQRLEPGVPHEIGPGSTVSFGTVTLTLAID